jgi:hypothetical protein
VNIEAEPLHPRADERSNVFLAAVLYEDSTPHRVRIRNVSIHGALVDGANLPNEGTRVRLERGSLSAHGQVAWVRGDQRGLRFDTSLNVAEWVRPTGHSGQRRVDMAIAAVRDDIRTASGSYLHSGVHTSPTTLESLSAELRHICEQMTELPGMSVQLAEAIGRIDVIGLALQQLGRGQ